MRASGLTATILLLTVGVAAPAAATPSAGPAQQATAARAGAVSAGSVSGGTASGTVIVPHVAFLPVDAAVDTIIIAGLWPDVRGAGTGFVTGQFPFPGTTVSAGSFVTIFTSGGGDPP